VTAHLTDVSDAMTAPRPLDGAGTRHSRRTQLRLADQTVAAANELALEGVDPTVSLPELQVLLLLQDGRRDDVHDVAEELGLEAPEVDRSRDRLLAAGHVVRREVADRRQLALTERGRVLAERLATRREQELAGLVDGMNEIDIRRLIRSLEAVEPPAVSRSAPRR
jgi:DNA-binding MarR family transcriptional regulator